MAQFTDKFFEDKAVGALWDVAVSIKRGNPLPLDKDAVVHGIDELNAVAAGAVSYPGQIIAVVIDAVEEVKEGDVIVTPAEPERIDLYYLDHNKTPRLVAPEVEIPEVPEYTGDNKSIAVTNYAISLLGFADAENGKLPMKEGGTIVWKSLEDIGAGDGNDDTTYTFEALTEKVGFKVQAYFNGQAQGDPVEIELANVYTKAQVDGLLDGKVDKTELTSNYYTKTEVDNLLKDYAKSVDVYTKTEVDGKFDALVDNDTTYTFANGTEGKFTVTPKDGEAQEVDTGAKAYVDGKVEIINDSIDDINEAIDTINGEITTLGSGKADKATTLAGYGITDAFTKEEVKAEIANADHLKREIVTTLPAVEDADENTIYMIKESDLTSGDIYKEYMLIDGKFELIGDSAVVLNDYYTKTEVNDLLDDKADKATTLEGYGITDAYTKTESDKAIEDAVQAEEDRAVARENEIAQSVTDLTNGTVANNTKAIEDLALLVANNETDIESKITTLTTTVTDNKAATDGAIALKADKTELNDYYTKEEVDELQAADVQRMSDTEEILGGFLQGANGGNVKDYVDALEASLYTGAYTKTNENGEEEVITSNIVEVDRDNSRLISPEEIEKLSALVINEDGSVGISGTISAENVTGLDARIESVVTGENALNIERGAQVNVIESIAFNGETITGVDKVATLPGLFYTEDEIDDLLDALTTKVDGKANISDVNALSDKIDALDSIYAKDSELTEAINTLTELINGKVAQDDHNALVETVNGHTGTLTNYGTRIGDIEAALPGLATTESVNKTLEDYAKSADVANTYVTKTEAEVTYFKSAGAGLEVVREGNDSTKPPVVGIMAEGVGTDQIAGNAVTEAKLDSKAVTTVKIADKAITTAKIADNAIGAAQTKAIQGYAGDDAEVWVFDCGAASTHA